MDSYQSAPVPSEVLERADVRQALAAHDFGRAFALIRKWSGISYRRIADACGIKPDRVGQMAKGAGRVTSYQKITEISDALRIPGSLVGLAPRPWEDSGEPVDDAGGTTVERRKFIRATLGSLGLSVSPAIDLHGSQGQRIGLDAATQLRLRAARLRQLDNYLGGADTVGIYAAEVESTRALLKTSTYNGQVERALLSVLAEQAQQAGWAAFDAGQHNRSNALYRMSLAAAQQAGDRALAANALTFTSYQQISTNRTGSEIAAAACKLAGPETPRTVEALLYERLAWAHAVEGSARGAEHALARAESALNRDDDAPQPDWSAWVDTDEVSIMSGRCWAELRRPLRAVAALEGALSRFDDNHARDKALYSTWLADAYVDAQETEQAAQVIHHCLDIVEGVGSPRPQQRAQEVINRLRPFGELPAVASLIERSQD